MLERLQLLRNVGQFESVTTGSQWPLVRNVLFYAENGRGKTTLTAILRSLRNGDPIPILERRRLSAANPPHVVIECAGGGSPAIFVGGIWNRTYPQMEIFDDRFVHENVCSGLDVASGHRQNLHELILGARGVSLHERVSATVEGIETANARIRNAANALSGPELEGLSVDDFCDLPHRGEIEEAIHGEERSLAATSQEQAIRATPTFEPIALPEIDLARVEAVLRKDLFALEVGAMSGVQEHLGMLGRRGEEWVAAGMAIVLEGNRTQCPFCAQALAASPLIELYRGYFSQEYVRLKQEIAELLVLLERQNGGDARALFERHVRIMQERTQFWLHFIDPPTLAFDTPAITDTWRTLYQAIKGVLESKQASPLEVFALPDGVLSRLDDHAANRQLLANLGVSEANTQIALVRERVGTSDVRNIKSNLARLRAIRNRYSVMIVPLCAEYLEAKSAKARAELERDAAKCALDGYPTTVFPGYQTAINLYLERLNAGFRVDRVVSADTRGGPTCNYSLVVNNTLVPIAITANNGHEPSFRTTLSAGDRNTLALAFFFAGLGQNPDLAHLTVVVDDPISSLDDHRILATTQELRRLGQRVAQLVILSHSKPFLCRVWEGLDRQMKTALKIERDGTGSTLATWNVEADSITEHDRRHSLLTDYLQSGPRANTLEVARSLRPHMEAYLRVSNPQHFRPGTLLGTFHNTCDTRCDQVNQILNRQQTDELFDIKEFANRYHHETNQAWETEIINDTELAGFVRRTLTFTSL